MDRRPPGNNRTMLFCMTGSLSSAQPPSLVFWMLTCRGDVFINKALSSTNFSWYLTSNSSFTKVPWAYFWLLSFSVGSGLGPIRSVDTGWCILDIVDLIKYNCCYNCTKWSLLPLASGDTYKRWENQMSLVCYILLVEWEPQRPSPESRYQSKGASSHSEIAVWQKEIVGRGRYTCTWLLFPSHYVFFLNSV